MSEGFRRVPVMRVGRNGDARPDDTVAVEEPLEVRLHGKPFAVIMRTPGSDRDLAAGFLLSEGVLRSADDLGAVEHCRHPHHPEYHNIVDVFLIGDARQAADRHLQERRNVLTNSSCGLCGRVTIESLQKNLQPIPRSWTEASQSLGLFFVLLPFGLTLTGLVAAAVAGRLRLWLSS